MKVIKQLSEDEFVIKMEDCDLEKESRMTIAHDYVQFGANMGLMLDTGADWHPTGKFAGAFSKLNQNFKNSGKRINWIEKFDVK